MDKGLTLVNPLFPKKHSNHYCVPGGLSGQPGPVSIKHQFEPRVGFAYKPFHGDNTVIRVGYGIYSNLILRYPGPFLN